MNRHETKKKTSEKKERKDKTETADVYTTRPGVVGSANVQVGKKDLRRVHVLVGHTHLTRAGQTLSHRDNNS